MALRHAIWLALALSTATPALADGPVGSDAPAPPPVQAAFWAAVSPELGAADATRWQGAVTLASAVSANAGPDGLPDRVYRRWRFLIDREARARGLSLPLVVAVIAVESAGNPRAISPKGAGGLMQLMPRTARRFGVRNSLAPAQNLRGGTRYLSWLLERYGGDVVLALAAYNAGEGAIDAHDGVPPYPETRAYVPRVAAAYAAARALCARVAEELRPVCPLE